MARRFPPRHFNPPAPCGAGQRRHHLAELVLYFNPPAPCGAGRLPTRGRRAQAHFNPPAPCGAGLADHALHEGAILFQSTRPLRGGTSPVRSHVSDTPFQSTRPLRGGTARGLLPRARRRISIHPPLAGRDFDDELAALCREAFQSTRPLRGGTLCWDCATGALKFQSPRPLRGGTDLGAALCYADGISIHPPLAGRDLALIFVRGSLLDFNPPAPCGAGLILIGITSRGGEFQSTRPLRGGTIRL